MVEPDENDKALLQTNERLEMMVNQRTQELRQANDFLDTVIENIPNMIFVKDAVDFKFVRFNRAGEDLLGRTREDLIGKGDDDFFPPEQAAAFKAKDRAVLSGRDVVDIPEEVILTARGERILHTKKIPVFDDAGRPLYLVGISEDITDLKKIEHERIRFLRNEIEKKESERAALSYKFLSEASAALGSTLDYGELLQRLARLTVPAIADWCSVDILQPDLSLKQIAIAHRDLEKEEWARGLGQKFYSDKNLLSGPMRVARAGTSQLVSEIDDAFIAEMHLDEIHQSILRSLQFRSYLGVPIRSRGRLLGVLSLYTTTDSHRPYGQADLHFVEGIAERAGVAVDHARLYNEAKQLNRVKDEFLATLSHELRTPLNVILGHAEILNQEKTLTPDQLKSSFEAIYRNAKTQTGLINDLLDVSAIITGKVSYRPTTLRPSEVVLNIVQSLEPSAAAKGVALVYDIQSVPPTAHADPTRLHQIIWNLVSNAVKFTPEGGTVQILVQNYRNDWEIAIQDNGRGIDPSFLPHVFDRFRQEDSSTTRDFGGLGLGLSIVRHLTELHGGSVTAFSHGKDQGSIFRVRIPHVDKAPPEPREPNDENEKPSVPVQSISLAGRKILLIEDSDDSRFLIHLILTKAGAEVIEARSASEARKKMELSNPDIIVSDIGMAEESGTEFIKKLRDSDSRFRATPAIALTAYVRSDERQEMLASGFQAHVGKPIQKENLLRTILAHVKDIRPGISI